MMKRFLVILSIMLLANTNMFANNEVKANSATKTIQIKIDNPANQAMVTLTDQNGGSLHKQQVIEQNYKLTFDVKRLPVGQYDLKISEIEGDKVSFSTYTIIIQNDFVVIGEEVNSKVYFPAIKQTGNELFLNMLSLNTTTSVSVEFKDAFGHIIHTDSFTANGNKGRHYSLDNLKAGEYTVTTFIEGQKIVRSFTVS